MWKIETILVTTDFSDTSRKAFEPARTLAEKFGARVVLCYVEEDRLPPFAGEFPTFQIEEILETHRKRAEQELKSLAEEHFEGRVPVDAVVGMGIPHREIVHLAEERKADLIVMATHGRGFLTHALFGSTAERVVRSAPCAVLTVRAGGE